MQSLLVAVVEVLHLASAPVVAVVEAAEPVA